MAIPPRLSLQPLFYRAAGAATLFFTAHNSRNSERTAGFCCFGARSSAGFLPLLADNLRGKTAKTANRLSRGGRGRSRGNARVRRTISRRLASTPDPIRRTLRCCSSPGRVRALLCSALRFRSGEAAVPLRPKFGVLPIIREPLLVATVCLSARVTAFSVVADHLQAQEVPPLTRPPQTASKHCSRSSALRFLRFLAVCSEEVRCGAGSAAKERLEGGFGRDCHICSYHNNVI